MSSASGSDYRWSVRGAAAVGGLATGLLAVFVTPFGFPLAGTLVAMLLVGGGTALFAVRRPFPSGAGAVSAGVAAVLLVFGGISTGLQTLLAAPASGGFAGLFRGGSYLLAVAGIVAGLFAAAVSVFFRRRAARRREIAD